MKINWSKYLNLHTNHNKTRHFERATTNLSISNTKQSIYYTFDLQLSGELDLRGRIGGDASVVARMRGGQWRNTEQRRVLIERRDIGAQQKGQRFAVLQPVQRQWRIAARHTANGARAHALGQTVLEGERLNDRRNWFANEHTGTRAETNSIGGRKCSVWV